MPKCIKKLNKYFKKRRPGIYTDTHTLQTHTRYRHTHATTDTHKLNHQKNTHTRTTTKNTHTLIVPGRTAGACRLFRRGAMV